MRTWLRAIVSTPTAADDFSSYLTELIDSEDKLSKAKTLEDLHYQRGKVEGLKMLQFALQNAKENRRG